MKIVIVGAGMIGTLIAQNLIQEGRDVVLIEKDTESAHRADTELDCMVICDDGSRPEILRKAGAMTADWFLALTGFDEVNIVSCGLVAAEAPNVKTLARVSNPFYSSLSEIQRKAFGLDILINPSYEAASAIHHIVKEGFAEDVIPLHNGRLQLRRVKASSILLFTKMTLREVKQTISTTVLLAAVVRDDYMIIPNGDFIALQDDVLYLLGDTKALEELAGHVEGITSDAKHICVIGATKIAERLIDLFIKASNDDKLKKLFSPKRHITLLDSSSDACKKILRSHSHDAIDILCGDSTEEGFLESMHISKYDLVICTTDSQACNILTAQLTKTLGATKSIAVTTNDRYMPIVSKLDVDAIISLKSVAASAVLETLRRAHIKTIYRFYEDDVELVELSIDATSTVVNFSLKEISLPSSVLVAFVLRGTELLVPSGSTVLNGADIIGLVAKKKNIVSIEKIFGASRGV